MEAMANQTANAKPAAAAKDGSTNGRRQGNRRGSGASYGKS